MVKKKTNKEEEQYRNVVAKLRNILNYKLDMQKIFGQYAAQIEKVTNFVIADLDSVIDKRDFVISRERTNEVKQMVDRLTHIVTYEPIVPILRDLTMVCTLLFHNWNQNVVKDGSLETRIAILSRLVNMQLTLIETIEIMKRIGKKQHELSQYRPPAFELSRHYLKSLEGD